MATNLPPLDQLINVDLFRSLQETDVGQFGPDYTNLERYKQAGEYALEAQMYAEYVEKIYNELKGADFNQIKEAVKDATDAAKVATDAAAIVEEDKEQIDSWVQDMSVSPFPFTSVGGETSIQLPDTFTDVRIVYVNGSRQEAGDDFIYDKVGHRVTLFSPLEAGDKVVALSSSVYEQTSTLAQTLQGVGGADYVKTKTGDSVQVALDKSADSITFYDSLFANTIDPEKFRKNGGQTDDEVFDDLFEWMSKQERIVGNSTSTRIRATPSLVDLRGRTYTLNKIHQLDGDWGIMNGTILFGNDGQIVMGDDVGTKTRRHALIRLHAEFIGDEDTDHALVRICRTFNTVIEDCNFRAGSGEGGTNSPFRSRYGLWVGSTRAWGIKITGGEYYGGKIACRVGKANDHTGITINGASFHHSSVANLLLCNPAGWSVTGCNIEHSDPGGVGLAVTSSTNSSGNAAQGGLVTGNYIYNNGNGASSDTIIDAAVIIGSDVPGTEGFDNAGLITSGNTAHSITVSNNYIVSPKQKRAVSMRGLYGLNVIDNKFSMTSGETVGVVFAGTCAGSEIRHNRNQSSDASIDLFESTASNPILVTRKGGWTPVLEADGTAGSNTYSARGGTFDVSNGMCKLAGFLVLDTKDSAMSGNLRIKLPFPCLDQQRSGAVISAINLTNTAIGTVVSGNVLSSSDSLNLYSNSVRLKQDMVTGGTAFHFSMNYPVDLKQ